YKGVNPHNINASTTNMVPLRRYFSTYPYPVITSPDAYEFSSSPATLHRVALFTIKSSRRFNMDSNIVISL
ncbi:hypothetical protein, partial [Salmonella enterica]